MFAITRSLLILSLSVITVSMAMSQPPKAQFAPMDREREEVAEKDIPKTSELNTMYRFAISSEPDYKLTSDADKAIADKVMKYYLYRLTWEEVQKDRDPARVGTISSIMSDLIGSPESSPRFLPRPFVGQPGDQEAANTRQRQLENVQQLTPIIVKHARVVLQNKQYIARLNAVRVLAKLAEWGQESVVDDLVNIINHPNEHDAVRLYAFQGLEQIFELNGTNDMRARGLFQSKQGAARFNTALFAVYDWLVARTKMAPTQLEHMQPDEVNAIRYIRRAAELALGASRRPLIVDDRAGGKQDGPIAQLLNNIVAADASIVPPASFRERLDATVALCKLRTNFSPSYQPDYSAFNIGTFLTVMGAEANSDKDNKENSLLAWRLEAQRLYVAIDGFAKQPTTAVSAAYLEKFKPKAMNLLVFIDDTTKNTDSISDLNNWLRSNRPPNDKVFKPLGEK